MSTDDRDIESSNPSKNFKVGDFDQRSGFFTPVWESKRRIRSEPPGPPSSTASASSRRGAPSPSGEPGEAPASDGAPASKGKGGQGSRSRSASGGKSRRSSATRNPTPVPPAASEGTPATLGVAALPPAVAAVFNPSVALEPLAEASSSRVESAAASAGVAAEPSVEPPVQASARPSAAARALRDAGPNLPPAAFLDAEPEFRDARGAAARDALPRHGVTSRELSPPEERTDRSPLHQRSLRATSAAARVHEQLRAKLQAEAAELDENRFDQTPDSQLPPLPSQDQENELYPQSLLRRLRRTIRLSTPVPDPIRSLISKYDRG